MIDRSIQDHEGVKFGFLCCLYIVIGIVLFKIKNNVMLLEQSERFMLLDIQKTKEDLHVLKAEWAYLNDPSQLKKLVLQYLPQMRAVKPEQILTKEKSLNDMIDKAIGE